MAYELIVLDIDGTLTTSEKIISDTTYRAIMAIQERGHKVVLASGRPTPGILPLAKQLKLDEYGGYILSFNGAKIINCQTGEVIYQKTLPDGVLPELYQAALEYQVGILSYEADSIIAGTDIDCYIKKEADINHIPYHKVENFPEYITWEVNKCIMTADGDYLATVEEKMKKRFGNILSIYRSEPFFLEIMPHNVDKADSLGKLLDYLGLSREQMISCGDGYNDLTMIQYAGMGVAMANARDIVKKHADYITLSNDEDGVAHVIDRFMLSPTSSDSRTF